MMKFKSGDRVLNKHNNKIMYIIECINENEPEDVKVQGYRYYCEGSKHVWSVTEQYLLLRPSKINRLQE